ncbi:MULTISPECIES: NADH:flavin oxidoreductase/NADH oxidase family protein [unclassified Amycolatopsis]|uniref:NADH:flavin oxidoreductase/NADH oxidase family protein n=1 Tax=unclassified Amycolatopsis TaxID=2618356 RepID=UPI002873F4B1|nr:MULTISPECIES: NADH:flavin oxidoreductase/NADH oxidase family protein [unclassified Amycolatopsis]MDS0137441.1 NADH:flavin oxidoreductase/NADH oxidase family protein [Amycolatopsis sp. 505]MDS0141636.1 NADH:flavin oxidoreductase/NADH oxidase family protein [Amycolatopsis sp. CM201R]
MTLLAEPLKLRCGALLPNRLVKSALSEQLGDRRNAPTRELAELYRTWAAGGAGALITGNVMVDPAALGEPRNVAATPDPAVYRPWAGAVEGTDTRLWVQLNHPGRQSPRYLSRQPVAPSVVPFGNRGVRTAFAVPRALTGEEIEAIIERFGVAARTFVEAGFTGVQIHGAHGYLVSQFLSPLTNRRTDAWGGDAVRRRRFLLELVRRVRAEVGGAVPVSVKLNSADFQRGGFTEEESLEVVRELGDAGIDLLEVSGGTYEKAAMMGGASTQAREAYFLDYAAKARAVSDVALMVTGGFATPDGMEAALRSGEVDVIGLGRPLIVDPALPSRLLEGADVRAERLCPKTGIRLVDSLLEIQWHTRQMHRIAAGRPVDRRGAVPTLVQAGLTDGVNAFRRVRG